MPPGFSSVGVYAFHLNTNPLSSRCLSSHLSAHLCSAVCRPNSDADAVWLLSTADNRARLSPSSPLPPPPPPPPRGSHHTPETPLPPSRPFVYPDTAAAAAEHWLSTVREWHSTPQRRNGGWRGGNVCGVWSVECARYAHRRAAPRHAAVRHSTPRRTAAIQQSAPDRTNSLHVSAALTGSVDRRMVAHRSLHTRILS